MKNLPEVSVIIPTYNRKDWIMRAIFSVFEQTYRDFQIIIIDDGSTDGTKEIIKKFLSETQYIIRNDHTYGKVEKDKVIYYRFEKNGGIPRALNKGYDLAESKFVCQLQSDDQWFPNKLETQLALCSDPTVGAVYSDYFFEEFDALGKAVREWYVKVFSGSNREMFRRLFEDCFIHHSVLFLRKELKDKIGPFPTRPEFEWNQDLWFDFQCIFSDYKIVHQPIATAKISIHPKQASKEGKCGLGNDVLFPEMHKEGVKRGWVL